MTAKPALAGALLVVAVVASWALTLLIERFARARAILDIPNERSSHQRPTPRGGGVAIAVVVLAGVALLAVSGLLRVELAIGIAGGAIAVAAVGWYDDRRGASPLARLLVHVAAAVWAMYWMGGLPTVDLGFARLSLGSLGMVVGSLIIVWCINLYNFMDGIDGIAAGEALSVGTIAGAILTSVGDTGLGLFLLLVAAAAAGFGVRNWSPAKIFMGDAGSGFLGFVFGCAAIAAENTAHLPLMLFVMLLGVFVVDATVTLGRRVLRGERWYSAHREHAYQRAVRNGRSHAAVSTSVICINCLLGGLAWVGVREPSRSLIVAMTGLLLVLALYVHVERAFPMRTGEAAQ